MAQTKTQSKPPAKTQGKPQPKSKGQVQKKPAKPAGPAAWKVMRDKWLGRALQSGPAKRLSRLNEALAILNALDRIRKAADTSDNDVTLTLQAIPVEGQPGGGWIEINLACDPIGDPLVFPCWAGSPMSTHLSHAAISLERHLEPDVPHSPAPKRGKN